MKKVVIDRELCIGCGLCTTACHNGVIEIIDGKAEVVKLDYCDGLGLCLPDCPTNAINVVEHTAAATNTPPTESATRIDTNVTNTTNSVINTANLSKPKAPVSTHIGGGCPGMQAKTIKHDAIESNNQTSANTNTHNNTNSNNEPSSELRQWPVQLKLINSRADYLQEADLLVAADCTAYAYSKFHRTFIKNHITVIACPKLDDNDYNIDKLTEIFNNSDINTVTIVKMSVPCCGGISRAVRQAVSNSGKNIPIKETTISTSGELLG